MRLVLEDMARYDVTVYKVLKIHSSKATDLSDLEFIYNLSSDA